MIIKGERIAAMETPREGAIVLSEIELVAQLKRTELARLYRAIERQLVNPHADS